PAGASAFGTAQRYMCGSPPFTDGHHPDQTRSDRGERSEPRDRARGRRKLGSRGGRSSRLVIVAASTERSGVALGSSGAWEEAREGNRRPGRPAGPQGTGNHPRGAAAERGGVLPTPMAAASAMASGSARWAGAEPCRAACTATAAPATSDIAERQLAWRVGG